MGEYVKKIFDLKALDVDSKNKQVKIAIAQLEDVDRDNDLFDPASFDKTIKERGPNGSNEIWHLLDHTKNSFSALSKYKELTREGNKITGVSLYKNSFAWREVAWPLYEAGDITQHSVGFTPLQVDKAKGSRKHNVIKEVALWEGSAVLWGAQPDTPTMQVVKSLLNIDEDRDITAAEKLDEIIRKVKDGKYDEEKQSLLIIELKRVQNIFDTKQITTLFQQTTKPDTIVSVQPEENVLLIKQLKSINQLFKHFKDAGRTSESRAGYS